MAVFAIIPAGGVGLRAIKNPTSTTIGQNIPKQYQMLASLPMIMHSIATLHANRLIKSIHIGVAESDEWAEGLELPEHCHLYRTGGPNRADTVLNTLEAIDFNDSDWVLVHDAARPGLQDEDLQRLIDTCLDTGIGGILAYPVGDTIKLSQEDVSLVASTVDRKNLWQAQTPQMFKAKELRDALHTHSSLVTDEASAIEASGGAVQLVKGSRLNFKVTWPEDFEMMEHLIIAKGKGMR